MKFLRGRSERKPLQNFNNSRGKKVWTEEEDESLKKLVEVHGTGNWTLIAQFLPERTGKQCRERFHNHLDNGIKKGDWTPEEDKIIIILQKALGNQWAKITKLLPGRTDNAVKNRFHATERAKLRGKLDESFLQDTEFTERIVKEALKLNGESPDEEEYDEEDSDDDSSVYSTVITENESYFTVNEAGLPIENDSMITDNAHLDAAVNQLMELDIISIDDDEADYRISVESSPVTTNNKNKKIDIDLTGFNFDWCTPKENEDSKKYNNNGAGLNFCGLETFGRPGNGGNYCGLEAWGRPVPQPQQHHVQYQQQPQQQLHQPPQPYPHAQAQYPPQYPPQQFIPYGHPQYHQAQAQMQYAVPMDPRMRKLSDSNPTYYSQQSVPPQAPQQQSHPSFFSPTTFFCSR